MLCSLLYFLFWQPNSVKRFVCLELCLGCERRMWIRHLEGLLSDVFTTRQPFQKVFGLTGNISRRLISIHMPPLGAALNCEACLSVSLHGNRSMCAREEEPSMFSISSVSGLQTLQQVQVWDVFHAFTSETLIKDSAAAFKKEVHFVCRQKSISYFPVLGCILWWHLIEIVFWKRSGANQKPL